VRSTASTTSAASHTFTRRCWFFSASRRFLESARTDGDPLYAAYVLILILGLRKGEVLGLSEGDVDPAGGS